MTHWISADQVFDGAQLLANHALGVRDNTVVDLQPVTQIGAGATLVHHTGLLTPGFFDIQVNGGGGVLLNSDPTVRGIRTIAEAHRAFGTVALMPTVITDHPEILEQAAEACLATKGRFGVKGLHIEGPHISTARRGTHAARFVRPMDDATLNCVRSLRDAGLPVLITLAPEAVTGAQITQLSDMGAVVSIGHSDTTAETIRTALAAGAACFTHLFNAMSPMLNRSPGVTGAAIASEAWCSIICDGIHVDPTMIGIAARARPVKNRMIAVSDSMATVGGPPTFDLYGEPICLKDGKLVNAEGSLAGAHVTLVESLQNLVRFDIPPEDALRMCRSNPAELLGLADDMQIIGCAASDIVALGDDLSLLAVGIDQYAMA